NGGFAVTVARFLPVVRTFVPIAGGIVQMNKRRFAFFNVLGAVIWVGLLCTLGYLLGENEWINQNLEWTLLGIVVVATLPVVIRAFIPSKPVKEVRTVKN
ncbi:MAG: DedA family protein, partial [Chitinophagaceae bacterium]|nr:DedA family protein [Chitinophagaceae bacterium]